MEQCSHLSFVLCNLTTAARMTSGSLADFLARKELADFLSEALLDFLAVGLTYSVCNILSYLKGTVFRDRFRKC
jgi:hypothetical protein